jgi:NADPH2:quinone reductase
LRAGDVLVVLGAGGGVGLAAVELGACMGATVAAVASSPEKLVAARAKGAAVTIDHRSGDLRGALRDAFPDGTDVVLDPVGGQLAEPALRSLRWGGRFVTVGYASGEIPRIPLNLVLLKGIRVVGFEFASFMAHGGDEAGRNEAEVMGLFASGRVRPHVGATFALDDTAGALRLVAEGAAIGKVVIDVAGGDARPAD